jgi:hypothetical protein
MRAESGLWPRECFSINGQPAVECRVTEQRGSPCVPEFTSGRTTPLAVERPGISIYVLTMRVPVTVGVLLLSLVPRAFCQVVGTSGSGVDEVVARMFARDVQREMWAGGYTGSRRYVLDNPRLHKHAELVVNVKPDSGRTKHFEVVTEEGWEAANKHVLRKMLESEAEASRPQTRPKTRLTPNNYDFQMVETDSVDGRSTYVIDVVPKRHDKFLFQGRIWVDAADYALIRAEGKPAKNPSFWTRSVHFVHKYQKTGPVWFPFSTESITDARIFGTTAVTINYFGYTPNLPATGQSSRDQVRLDPNRH